MARISIDNGMTFGAADEIADDDLATHWDALVNAMDDAGREAVHARLAPCTDREYLAAYLAIAPCDLCIG